MDLRVKNLDFSYTQAPLLREVSFECVRGTPTWIRGSSGTGKSTFLKLCAGLLSPVRGTIEWGATDFTALQSEEKLAFRRSKIGYIHQDLHLVGHWTVEQNLSLADPNVERQAHVLSAFGLTVSPKQLASDLSGGEKQRLVLARVVLQDPEIVLADEPTAHLDDDNTGRAIRLMVEHFGKKTLVIVSHDQRVGQWIKRTHEWKAGRK